ncbi:MAG: indolepyruvate ferredoxin oxidoreductase family protein [Alphaproteobacteria bacterium]|nr:indolepyruvate ferredoxin oxidoreductase family protein [Alphaproteobacteria bacterium]
MTVAPVTLEDKYTLPSGRVYLSGVQALVRLPMMQQERDRAAGLKTAGFISGYRGSPLAAYDTALHQARRHLAAHDIHFQPGVNEDLAATALWGSQQVNLYPTAKFDGVFGIWYGKGPGVDRSMDPFKHANFAGTSLHGGVLAIAGDDHGCQSSTTAHQSEQLFLAAMMPLLNPATIQEYLDYGLYGFALSRFAGVWVGFKAISETVESSASIVVDPQRMKLVVPRDFAPPPGGLNIRWPDTALEQERRLHGPKMAAVAAFARANPLDRLVFAPPHARLGIMATGKAYLDLRQALDDLGLSEAQCLALGFRLYKVGMAWPLESDGARRFAEGLDEVLVVEEKRGFVEDQLMRALYNLDAAKRPRIVGKTDETGASLLPSAGELTPTMVARALVTRLKRLNAVTPEIEQRLQRLLSFESIAEAGHTSQRLPYFCAGCPHNTSTRVPEGSRALAGIGCHFMAIWMPRATATYSHMGGEGAAWIGQAPFTEDKHVFQNLGDGTYSHSGLLAIRAAAVAGVNITYKILYNDAVAMTGGQPVEGQLTVGQIARQVAAEGATKIVVVTDEPGKYPSGTFASDIDVRHRDELDTVQRELRDIAGLTILIYDQTCAAEKRRRRKRGTYPDPAKRVFINDAVCEGCGDCSEKSNCVAVKPLETEFGRKRTIDQSSCNKDFSCLKGFCPSFVTVHGGELRRLEAKRQLRSIAEHVAALPPPAPKPLGEPYNILIAGIGGTGVITVGALLGMAAHLDGKGCSVLDFTGLAQKNGAVLSHVRIAPNPEDLHAVRVAAAGADLVLGCDMVVAASPTALARIEHGVTHCVVNSDYQPTAAFVMNPDVDFETAALTKAIRNAAGDANAEFVDATGLATALLGDSIASNLFMLGYAVQKGLVPIGAEAIERAIELNGVAVEMNKHAFAWGRLAAHDHRRVEALVHPAPIEMPKPAKGLVPLVERRSAFLTRYQDAAYAARYRDFVGEVERAERARMGNRSELAEAVAENLFKLMAYKDEYEVARLYTDGEFLKKLHHQFAGNYRLEFHLAPPTLAKRDPATGELQKQAFGPWMFTAFRLLARLKFLRGSAWDPFGRTPERRMERRLIAEYRDVIGELVRGLTPANHALAVEIARVPERIRGFGHIKERSIVTAKAREAALMAAFRAPAPEAHAAE